MDIGSQRDEYVPPITPESPLSRLVRLGYSYIFFLNTFLKQKNVFLVFVFSIKMSICKVLHKINYLNNLLI